MTDETRTDPAGLAVLSALLIVLFVAVILTVALWLAGVARGWWPLGFTIGLGGTFAVACLTVGIHDAREDQQRVTVAGVARGAEGSGGLAED